MPKKSAGRAANIKTPEFRGSFVHLFEEENDPVSGQPNGKNSLLMMFPKKSDDWTADLPWLLKNAGQAISANYPDGDVPDLFKDVNSKGYPVKDGDLPNNRGNVQEAHKGHWVVRTASKRFDANVNLIKFNADGKAVPVPKQECYSGAYFQAVVNAYVYDTAGNLGVAMGLNNVLLTRAGEALGGSGGEDAASAFGVEAAEESATGAFNPSAAAKETSDDKPAWLQ